MSRCRLEWRMRRRWGHNCQERLLQRWVRLRCRRHQKRIQSFAQHIGQIVVRIASEMFQSAVHIRQRVVVVARIAVQAVPFGPAGGNITAAVLVQILARIERAITVALEMHWHRVRFGGAAPLCRIATAGRRIVVRTMIVRILTRQQRGTRRTAEWRRGELQCMRMRIFPFNLHS